MKKFLLALLGVVSISFLIKSLLSIVNDVEFDEDAVDEDRANDQF
ncbi:hypothetical protein [Staphylococcus caeli]